MNILLNDINCPYCDSTSLRREENRYGFCYTIVLSCSACDTQVSSTYSSRCTAVKHSSQPFVVNDLIVLLFNQLGLGHTAMKKFSLLFGWEGLHLKTFQRKESRVISTIIDNTE